MQTSSREPELVANPPVHPGALLGVVSFLLCGILSGCAAITNPVADGLPVRRLPPELLEPAKDEEETIPLPLLGQPPPDTYRLAPGDVLGVLIGGVLGGDLTSIPAPSLNIAPPLLSPVQRKLPPGVGYPIPVREDGTILLPLVEPLSVQGTSLGEVQEAIRALYVKKGILKAGNERIVVTLLYHRQHSVLVFRQEAAGFSLAAEGLATTSKRGTGYVIDLPAYENDVMHALAQTGGLPGLDAYNEVIVQHGCFKGEADRALLLQELQAHPPVCGSLPATGPGRSIVHIPLRMRPGTPPPFGPEDVVLQTGDVVFIEARDRDVFYTGGLLPSGEHVVPRDKDLDVLEAVAQVRGPLVNGAFATNSLSGNLIEPGIGNPSPSLLVVLRRTPGGGQVPIRVDLNRAMQDPRERILVQRGDVLILQEKPSEAMTRYFTRTFFNFSLAWQVLHEKFATGVIDVSAPERIPNRISVGSVTTR